jgi:hypothetical protein
MTAWEAAKKFEERYRPFVRFPFHHPANTFADEENNGYPTFEDFPYNYLENVFDEEEINIFEDFEIETETTETRLIFNREHTEDEDESEDESENEFEDESMEKYLLKKRKEKHMLDWEVILENLKQVRIENRR